MSAAPQPAAVTMIGSSPDRFEGVDVLPGQHARLVHHAGVDVERAAALLADRDVDVGAVAGHDAGRGAVGVGEDGAHDAAVEQSRAAWRVADGSAAQRSLPGTSERREIVRHQRFESPSRAA